jgi:hypothetical protein
VGLLVEGFGQVRVKDPARQIRPCCFICFYLHSVGVGNVMCGIASSHHPPSLALLCAMSRTGRGGGRGGFGGRSSFGASNPPPMGLTYADIQAMSREQGALYPVRPHSPSCMFILTALRIYSVASWTPSCIDRVLRRGEAYVQPTRRLCNSIAQICLSRDGSDQVKRYVVLRGAYHLT